VTPPAGSGRSRPLGSIADGPVEVVQGGEQPAGIAVRQPRFEVRGRRRSGRAGWPRVVGDGRMRTTRPSRWCCPGGRSPRRRRVGAVVVSGFFVHVSRLQHQRVCTSQAGGTRWAVLAGWGTRGSGSRSTTRPQPLRPPPVRQGPQSSGPAAAYRMRAVIETRRTLPGSTPAAAPADPARPRPRHAEFRREFPSAARPYGGGSRGGRGQAFGPARRWTTRRPRC